MLSQGWSSYNLTDKIHNINPKEVYKFESGFTINGAIQKHPKHYDIGILSNQNRLAAYSKIDENIFSFKNVYAYKKDTIKLALIKKNEPLIKPEKVSFIHNNQTTENYKYLVNPETSNTTIKTEQINNEYGSSYYFYNKVEQLDTVILDNVKAKKMNLILKKN